MDARLYACSTFLRLDSLSLSLHLSLSFYKTHTHTHTKRERQMEEETVVTMLHSSMKWRPCQAVAAVLLAVPLLVTQCPLHVHRWDGLFGFW